MSYRQMKEILQAAPHLRSFPVVTDNENKILLGSVAKRYLTMLLRRHVLLCQQDSRVSNRITPTEIFNTIRRTSMRLSKRNSNRKSREIKESNGNSTIDSARSIESEQKSVWLVLAAIPNTIGFTQCMFIFTEYCVAKAKDILLGTQPQTLAAMPLQAVFSRPSNSELKKLGESDQEALLDRVLDLDEIAIDAAPFQLVLGSSLYKVHTLFSLLGLSHAYVTDCGKLVGVVGLKELRDAMANIYVRGAVAPVKTDRKLTSGTFLQLNKQEQKQDPQGDTSSDSSKDSANGSTVTVEVPKFGNNLTVPNNV